MQNKRGLLEHLAACYPYTAGKRNNNNYGGATTMKTYEKNVIDRKV